MAEALNHHVPQEHFECPDCGAQQVGKQGLATRQECVEWLRRHGSSQDDELWLQWEAWQNAAAEGEEVEWV